MKLCLTNLTIVVKHKLTIFVKHKLTMFVKHLTIIVKHWLTIFRQQQQKGKDLTESTGVVPTEYPPKVKLELFSQL